MPSRVWSLIGILVVVASITTVAAWAEAIQARPEPGQLVAVVLTVLIGDISLLRIRIGHSGNSFTWAEAALIVGVTIGGWAWFLALAPPTVFIRQVVMGRAPYKAAYNAATIAVGGLLARLVYGPVAGDWSYVPADTSWRVVAALVLAALVYFLVVGGLVMVAVAWTQGIRPSEVWRRGQSLRWIMFAGNSATGLGAVLLRYDDTPAMLALPFFFALLYLTYNSYLRAQQDRDTWRALHAATLAMNRFDRREIVRAVREGAENLFGAERTCFLLIEEDSVLSSARAPALLATAMRAGAPVVVAASVAPPDVQVELEALGLTDVVLAPLDAGRGRLGCLLVGFRGPVRVKDRELKALATFANHAALSLEHARLFAEMDAQRSRLSAIVDNASDGIVLLDRIGRVCLWNPGMTRITGRAEEEAQGQLLGAALDARREDGESLTASALLDGLGYSDHLEAMVTVPSGPNARRELSLSVAPVRDEQEACEYAVLVARDITAQREVEMAREDFLATVSHELRTPLTPLKGYLHLLRRPKYEPDRGQLDSIYSMMLEQTVQLERLVEDLLSVARMEHGHFEVTRQQVDVDLVVRTAVRDFTASTTRSVRLVETDPRAAALGDAARLRQVLGNLLSNADKYSPQDGPIHVAVRRVDHQVELTVRDFGPGIPEEYREAVFERFRRLGDHMTRRRGGTGLGLYIARRLVEAMGGRIWVDAAQEGGAVFHVVLPAALPHTARVAEDDSPATVA